MTSLFHIHPVHDSCAWAVGATIPRRGTTNRYMELFERSHVLTERGQRRPWVAMIRNYLRLPPAQQTKEIGLHLLRHAEVTMHRHGMFRRELIFEKIRRREFPDRPSRRTCLFLTPYGFVPFWWGTMSVGAKAKLFKVKPSGNMHTGFNGWLEDDTLYHDELRANARRYWQGDKSDKNQEEEVLLDGDVVIEAEYVDLADFQKNATP